uniref:Triacylglycerol lipase n=1 Tax=Timema monikensis TaxID=170555 RepID=A0A7R9EKT9_9NEOP|nr:unnamed protein product [Timema monikensis]
MERFTAGILLCSLFVLQANTEGATQLLQDINPDAYLSVPELITKYGYPMESHTVTTEDGYILTMHRIPYGKISSDVTNRPAVLVQHGLFSSSADWIVMGPGKGLGELRRAEPPWCPSPGDFALPLGGAAYCAKMGLESLYLDKVYPHLRGEGVGKPFCKTTLSTPGQNSNLDLPDICSPVYCESSSLDYVHPEEGYTGYILADAGFDVWLGNYRGNSYSNQHISLDTDSADYWDFSWHENGFYDLPAMIDHIRSQTGQDKIYYIGHSMGTTGFYVMGSMRPEYNDKIRAMFSLAPIAYMSHMTSPFLQLISKYITELQILRGLIGLNEFSPNSEFLAEAGQLTCSDEAPTQSVCGNVVFLFTGFDSQQLNETMLPVILGHTPAGASTRQIIHYGQEVKSGYFRQYDHGSVENLLKYGSLNPPDYDLSKVTAPVSLHYSNNDWLASLTDVDELYSELPNVIGKFLVPLDQFNHIDYMWAIDAKTLVYDTVISIMSQY